MGGDLTDDRTSWRNRFTHDLLGYSRMHTLSTVPAAAPPVTVAIAQPAALAVDEPLTWPQRGVTRTPSGVAEESFIRLGRQFGLEPFRQIAAGG